MTKQRIGPDTLWTVTHNVVYLAKQGFVMTCQIQLVQAFLIDTSFKQAHSDNSMLINHSAFTIKYALSYLANTIPK
jgi:hypothetical protein